MKKSFSLFLIFILIITVCTSCSVTKKPGMTDDGRLTVITTVFPVCDWTRNITGDKCNVIYLDESGTDMHSFEPTASDIAAIAQADVFIHIGGVSDEWVSGAVEAANNPDIVTLSLISVTDVLEEETTPGMQTHEHDHETDITEYDEHIWLSLKNAQTAVSAICDTLCTADEANSQTYKANAASYNEKLSELDKKFEAAVASAKRNTILVADRFPFRYMTEDYGIGYYAAFPGCSAESEASFETMTFLIEKTKELSLPCILVIENSDGKLAETIKNETGTKVLTLNSCQSVKQEDIDNGLTYISAMESNLSTVTEALN